MCHRGVLSLDNLRHGLPVDSRRGLQVLPRIRHRAGRTSRSSSTGSTSARRATRRRRTTAPCATSRARAPAPQPDVCASCHPSTHDQQYLERTSHSTEAQPLLSNCAQMLPRRVASPRTTSCPNREPSPNHAQSHPYGTILGALLLSAACENGAGAPGESAFVPRPKTMTVADAAPLMKTKVTGFVYDPEAFWLSIATCPSCPFPPLLLDNSPLFLCLVLRGRLRHPAGSGGHSARALAAAARSVGLRGHLEDGRRAQPRGPAVPAADARRHGGAAHRHSVPPAAGSAGQLRADGDAAPGVHGQPRGAMLSETAAIGDKGILQAVAKYLTNLFRVTPPRWVICSTRSGTRTWASSGSTSRASPS